MDSFDIFIFNLNIFQFHKGTIKTLMLCLMYLLQRNFNSIKVRLKHSIARIDLVDIATFQFLKGTIKTKMTMRLNNIYVVFQFHKGTIKT